MISSYKLDRGETLQLVFYTEVKNMAEIVEKLSGAPPQLANCTVINPELILDPFQVLVAANKAVIAKSRSALITRNLCTELLFNLSISDNITESLQKFGYGSNTDDLLIAIIGDGDPQLLGIQGKLEPIDVLREKCNSDEIRRTYDVKEKEICTEDLLDLIVTKIACKSIR